VPELGALGFVRGALSNGRPYREYTTRLSQSRGETMESMFRP